MTESRSSLLWRALPVPGLLCVGALMASCALQPAPGPIAAPVSEGPRDEARRPVTSGALDAGALRAAREAAAAKVPSASPEARRPSAATLRQDAERALDGLHAAARAGDRERYLASFTPEAVFVGTDGTERWGMATVREYVGLHMAPGSGWPYTPWDRHLVVDPGGEFAWFDERLRRGDYDEVRGTGVLRRVDGVWLVTHYCMAYTIPIDLSESVVELVRRYKGR